MLAVAVGRYLGLSPRLTVAAVQEAYTGPRHYERAGQAVEASAASARSIQRLFPDAIWLVHPNYWDYQDKVPPLHQEALSGFRAMLPDVEFVEMIDRVPQPRSPGELDSWFNVPDDMHNSDLGLRIYGEAVLDFLQERFRGERLP